MTHCSIEVFDTPARAGAQHRAGLRRLFRLQLKDQVKFLEKSLSSLQMTQVRASTIAWLSAALPSYEELREQIVTAALDRTCLILPLPTDRAAFIQRKEEARGKLTLIAQELARLVASIVDQAGAVARKLPALKAFPRSVADAEQQLSQLFTAGFIVSTPPLQLAQFPRVLRAIELRMDKAKGDPARDTAQDERSPGSGHAVATCRQRASGCQRPAARRVSLAARRATCFAFRPGIEDANARERQALAKVLGKRKPMTRRETATPRYQVVDFESLRFGPRRVPR